MVDKNQYTGSSKDSDARYFPRWDVDNRLSYCLEGDDQFFEGKTKDISCAGACIISEVHIAPRQKIKISIELSKGNSFQLNAYILWVRMENNQNHMGITFYDTPDEFKDQILNHAFELDKEKVLKHWFKDWNK